MTTKTKPAAIATAYSYLRFSSPAQAEGDSVRRQTAIRDGWLRRHPEARLDTSLTLADRGVSGYRGEHRTNRKHALAQFLDLVERGRVERGSYLIVENLDRLTRENPVDAIPAVLGLIKAGVRVVQLAPVEVVYDAEMDQGRLMMMLWELSRGHTESKRKSGLLGEAWKAKKGAARADRTPHGKAVPAWLELRDGKYRVRADAARTVRTIFRLSAQGLGTWGIVHRLREDGVPPIGKTDRWSRAYVAKILSNPAVIGTYQPMTGRPKRVPDGDPVPNYFPAVVTEAEWYAARGASENRSRRTGRPPAKGPVHPLSGLLRCALTGASVHIITRHVGGRPKRALVSSRAIEGNGVRWCQFPLDEFTDALLTRLAELRGSDLFAEPGGRRVAELTSQVADIERRLAAATARFEADPDSEHWQRLVSKYDRERRAAVAELAEERQKAATPLSASWAEAVRLMTRDDPARLRPALLATVEGVWCLFVPVGPTKSAQVAAVQVWFKGGGNRAYAMMYRPRRGTAPARPVAARTLPMSGRDGELDLRNPDHAAELGRALASVDPAEFTRPQGS